MTIQWRQTAWYPVKHKMGGKAWRWSGNRKDGRTFIITHIHGSYVATSYNGTRIGLGKSLAEAQALCEKVPGVTLARIALVKKAA